MLHAKNGRNNPSHAHFRVESMSDELKAMLTEVLPRDLWIDLIDMAAARALAAHEVIRDHTDLKKGKNARGAEGQVRFRLWEEGFESVCALHGGIALGGGVMPNTDLKFFQPFMRFEQGDAGVVMGLASMPVPRELPAKNQSRLAGVSLNCFLTPQLDLGKDSPKPGDVFLLFLVARDPVQAGHVQEIALGIIDGEYRTFLVYEVLEDFLARYAPADEGPDEENSATPTNLVTLKIDRKAYRPPENSHDARDEGDKDGTI